MASLLIVIAVSLAVSAQPAPQYADNLRNALDNDDRIMGLIGYHMLMDHGIQLPAIRDVLQGCFEDSCPDDDRIQRLMIRCEEEGRHGTPTPPLHGPQLTRETMAERLVTAQNNLNEYTANPAILERIVAIDEHWIEHGRFQIVAAYHRDEIIAHMFLPEGVSLSSAYLLRFISFILEPRLEVLGVAVPIILMDRLPAHVTEAVNIAISTRGWLTMPHASWSQDMMPLDMDGFPLLKKMLRKQKKNDSKQCYRDRQDMEAKVTQAINDLNASGELSATTNLPAAWRAVIAVMGDQQSPRRVTPTKSSRMKRDAIAVPMNWVWNLSSAQQDMGMTLDDSCAESRSRMADQCFDPTVRGRVNTIFAECMSGFCWSTCNNSINSGMANGLWCRTSVENNNNLTSCLHSYECEPCWECAENCSSH